MALYAMVSEKSHEGVYWTNRYIIEAATLADAVTTAGEIRTIEREVHYNVVNFTKYRVSDQVEGTDVYQIINDGVTGDLTIEGTPDWLPKFCRTRVDFNTDGGGRPSRKYLCPPMHEGIQQNADLTSSWRTFVQTNYVAPLVALTGFVDVDGQAFGSGSVSQPVGMHQLRRGSRRRATPVI